MMNIDDFVNDNKEKLHMLQIEAFQKLTTSLEKFFNQPGQAKNINTYQVQTFASIALESTDIIRSTNCFHGNPMFSNVEISGKEEQLWYSVVCI